MGPALVAMPSARAVPLTASMRQPVCTRMPACLSFRFTSSAISGSNAFGITCGAASITVTERPCAIRFSAVSSPIKPAPTTAARRQPFAFT